MKKISLDLESKLRDHYQKLDRLGLNAEDSIIILLLLTLVKEKIEYRIKIEQNPLDNDLSLFQVHGVKLDLNIEQIRVELENVSEKQKYLLDVIKILNNRLRTLSIKWYEKIIDILEEFNEGDLISHFPEIFDSFLSLIAERQGKKSGEFILPSEISGFLMELANPNEDAQIFNPFAGYSTFGTYLSGNQFYHGQEIDKLIWAISMMRLNAYDRLDKSNLQNVDSFKHWPVSNLYDLVISNPPFKLKLDRKQQIDFPGIKTVEYFFIKKGVELLKENGKLISLVPLSFLNSLSGEKEIRQHLVHSDILEAVIAFPGGLLMQTNIPFAVVLVNRNKRNKDAVLFIDGDKFVKQDGKHKKQLDSTSLMAEVRKELGDDFNENLLNEPSAKYNSTDINSSSIVIPTKQIKELDFNLDIERYRFESIQGTPLKDLVKQVPLISKEESNQWLLKNAPLIKTVHRITQNKDLVRAKSIMIRDLKNDPLDYYLDFNNIESKELKNRKIISGNALLVSLKGKSVKPTYVQSKDAFFYIDQDILPLNVDSKKLDLDWFVNQLHSAHIKSQVELLSSGGAIPGLKKEDFFSLKLKVPSLKEQRQEIASLKRTYTEIENLETEIIQQNSFLRHTLAGPITDLEDAIKNIDIIIENVASNYLTSIKNFKPSDKHLFNLGQLLEDSKMNISKIMDTVKSKLNASKDIDSKVLSPVDLFQILKNYIGRKSSINPGYDLKFDYDEPSFKSSDGESIAYYIKGNEELLIALFDNLIDNALKHAFHDYATERIEFYLSALVEEDYKTLILLVSNTGKPIADGFNIDKLSMKGYRNGPNQGDGFGGWYMNEIIRKHKSKWDYIDETGPEGLGNTDLVTSFEITFPISEDI